MISLASPLWLIGLCLLPAIWWLHRQSSRQEVKVVADFLWQTPEKLQAFTDSLANKEKTDPIWKLRATIVTLLCFALGGPYMPRYLQSTVDQAPPADIRIDKVTIRHGIEVKNQILLRLTLSNTTDRPQSAIIDLSTQNKTAVSRQINLSANEKNSFTETLSAKASHTLQLRLRGVNNQATINIPLAELQPLPLMIMGDCPSALTVLLGTLEDKQLIEFPTLKPALQIACGSEAVSRIVANSNIPTIMITDRNQSKAITDIPYWRTAIANSMSFQLAPEWFKVSSITPEPNDSWLLATAHTPLIIQRHQQWHLLFDLNEPALTTQPSFPLLVMALLNIAAPQYKLEPSIVQSYSPQDSLDNDYSAQASKNFNAPHWSINLILLLILVALIMELVLSRRQTE